MKALFVALLPLVLVACKTAADAPVVTTLRLAQWDALTSCLTPA